MDWNKFMAALRAEGVSEITLKFGNIGNMVNDQESLKVDKKPDDTSAQIISNTTAAADNDFVCTETKPVEVVPKKEDGRIIVFRKEHPNWFTLYEVAPKCSITASALYKLAKTYLTPTKKVGKTVFYDFEDFWLKRKLYEDDIIKHDGDRQGNVKFIADTIEKMFVDRRTN